MANMIIDGTIEEAKLRRSGKGQAIFDTVTIRKADGGRETLRKLIVATPLVDALWSGTTGRFYLHSIVDQRGLHGFRAPNQALFAFPTNVEKLLGILGALNALMLVVWIALDGGVRLLPAIFAPLCLGLFFVLRSARRAAEREFAGDGNARPAAQPGDAQAASATLA